LSFEKLRSGRRRFCRVRKAIRGGATSASPGSVLRSLRPQTRLETSCTRTGRPRGFLLPNQAAGRRAKGSGRKARAHVCEESDRGVLPMNQSNKDERLLAEIEEGRPLIEENTHQPNTRSTQSGQACHWAGGVRKAAKDNKEMNSPPCSIM